MRKIERAIISVTDKAGVVEFAKSLSKFGWKSSPQEARPRPFARGVFP